MIADFLECKLEYLTEEEIKTLLQELKKYCDKKMSTLGCDIQDSVLTLLENQGLNLIAFQEIFQRWKAYKKRYGFIKVLRPKKVPQTENLFFPYITESNVRGCVLDKVTHLQTNALCLDGYDLKRNFPNLQKLTCIWIDKLLHSYESVTHIHYWHWEDLKWRTFFKGETDTLRVDMDLLGSATVLGEEIPSDAFLSDGTLALTPVKMPFLFKKET